MPAQLTIDLLTLFPDMVKGFLTESIMGRAMERGLLDIRVRNLRDWAPDKHHVADDRPFGGGAGMVMKPEPIFAAIGELRTSHCCVIYMTPDGELLTSAIAHELSQSRHLIILSGHYEGVDQRARDQLVDREISIGDYVLTNGTLPAAVLIDATSRHIPGVLGDEMSLTQDSFAENLLSFPQYTRPAEYAGLKVPDVLLTGHHGEIERWRLERRMEKTRQRRPDLLKGKKRRPVP